MERGDNYVDNHRYLAFLFCLFLCGCQTSRTEAQLEKMMETSLLDSISNRSAEREFEENIKSGELVFYVIGSHMLTIDMPGLSEEDANTWIIQRKVKYQVEFQADPGGLGETPEYWAAVIKLCTNYNKLVLDHLIRRNNSESN